VVAAMAGLCPGYLEFATPDQTRRVCSQKKANDAVFFITTI